MIEPIEKRVIKLVAQTLRREESPVLRRTWERIP
jgi:hypothetical protein